VVVKIEGERQLSAVEKAGGNVYALYRLSTQLRMKDIRKVASQTKHFPYRDEQPSNYDLCEREWWSEVGSAEYPFDGSPVDRAALDMGVGIRGVAEQSTEPSHISLLPSMSLQTGKPVEAAQVDGQPTMSEILGQVRRQYFDTLYLAKVRRLSLYRPASTNPISDIIGVLCEVHIIQSACYMSWRRADTVGRSV
jgi:hypothetical protein